MDILIKGMEMPKDTGSITVTIYSDGSTGIWTEQEMISGGMAVALPEHGRLIDLDAYLKASENMAEWEEYRVEEIEEYFENCPVIVEATE